jgi:hypothetical protein
VASTSCVRTTCAPRNIATAVEASRGQIDGSHAPASAVPSRQVLARTN